MTEDDDRIARLTERVAQLVALPSPEREERLTAMIDGLSPEDREAFQALAHQKQAHAQEMTEHWGELIGTAGSGAEEDGGIVLEAGLGILSKLEAQTPADLALELRAMTQNELVSALFAAVVVFGLTRKPGEAPPAIAALYESWRALQAGG
jgi:hypothetical protein